MSIARRVERKGLAAQWMSDTDETRELCGKQAAAGEKKIAATRSGEIADRTSISPSRAQSDLSGSIDTDLIAEELGACVRIDSRYAGPEHISPR